MKITPSYNMDFAVRGQLVFYAVWHDLSDGAGLGWYIVSHKPFDGSKELMYLSNARGQVRRCFYKCHHGDDEPSKFQKHKIRFLPAEPAQDLDIESKRARLS